MSQLTIQNNLTKNEPINFLKDEQSEFISAYISFISWLGFHYQSDTWWATWISSRNRFNSPILKICENIWQKKTVSSQLYGSLWFYLKHIRHGIFYTFKIFCQISVARWKLAATYNSLKKQFQKKPVYVIKTFSYENSFKQGQFNDVFFHSLPEFLKNKKNQNVLTFVDPIGGFWTCIKECSKLKTVIPYHVCLRWYDVFRIWGKLFSGLLVKHLDKAEFAGTDVIRYIKAQYRHDLIDANAFHNFCLHFAVQRLAKDFNLSHFLMTLENNPWEKLCTMALRKENRNTKIIGYQHTVVPQASTNMFPAKGELQFTPTPDLWLTVGEENIKILKRYGYFENVRLEPSCALRFKYLESLQVRTNQIERTLLVALEGVPEAVKMLDYVIHQIANSLAGWKVIVRTHPALRIKDMKADLTGPSQVLDLIKISETNSLLTDLNRSGVVMYWGSTVALESLKLGIPIIHFDDRSILSYDPLFDCSYLKWTVDKDQNLFTVLEEITSLSNQELKKMRALATSYLDSYFYPVTDAGLEKFL